MQSTATWRMMTNPPAMRVMPITASKTTTRTLFAGVIVSGAWSRVWLTHKNAAALVAGLGERRSATSWAAYNAGNPNGSRRIRAENEVDGLARPPCRGNDVDGPPRDYQVRFSPRMILVEGSEASDSFSRFVRWRAQTSFLQCYSSPLDDRIMSAF